jgi:muramoyltetrapeptide carboxypeptidase
LEDDDEAHKSTIDRDLQSIIHQDGFEQVRGIVFGRFQPSMDISKGTLEKIIKSKKELSSMPVIANVDFGHTTPIITFPIGGECEIRAGSGESTVMINKH